ncbi:hypothetical protein AT15_05560 [Kosmotoga arenicorallina S304]|uniref:Sialate O-acetylesterase domain-containing protein n=1 Tax=Kosmotoga arenicorallina S304 TaxID=1453497 RepID=A0A182C802_9BACT|nr:sialate O-acetylesterase [Kosmotoga arenicorallina]OAA31541.1 hypothetical protein AT15_05560 [Kosmotoga arenicorallina S304]
MSFGAFIEKGPKDWQIFQQVDGQAKIKLSGRYVEFNDADKDLEVYVRVVTENSFDTVIPWTQARTAEGKKWFCELNVPVGGLYRLETCLKPVNVRIEQAYRGDMVHHFGVGDLFVIAGQSNSAGYGKDPIYDPPELGIHILKNNGHWDLASHPLNDTTNIAHPANMEGINPGHSPYLHFARLLKKELGYPIGLIQTSLGGSSLSQWNPEEEGSLYFNMIDIINTAGGNIRGILWYQGCSDVLLELCDTYLDRFKTFVKHLRNDLDDIELPVFTVQLNRFVADPVPWANTDKGWATVRNAQRLAAKEIKDVYVVPTLNITLSDNIHNSAAGNLVIGERLAKSVLKHVYGKNYRADAPDIARAKAIGTNKLELTFSNVKGSLYTFDLPPENLPIVVEDSRGINAILSYEIDRDKIILHLERAIGNSSFVHGCHEMNPSTTPPIDSEGHLPMLSFYKVQVVFDE